MEKKFLFLWKFFIFWWKKIFFLWKKKNVLMEKNFVFWWKKFFDGKIFWWKKIFDEKKFDENNFLMEKNFYGKKIVIVMENLYGNLFMKIFLWKNFLMDVYWCKKLFKLKMKLKNNLEYREKFIYSLYILHQYISIEWFASHFVLLSDCATLWKIFTLNCSPSSLQFPFATYLKTELRFIKPKKIMRSATVQLISAIVCLIRTNFSNFSTKKKKKVSVTKAKS